MSKGIPVAVLVARLENELETMRHYLAGQGEFYERGNDALHRCIDLAKQIRDAL